jgi:hypothetical protein
MTNISFKNATEFKYLGSIDSYRYTFPNYEVPSTTAGDIPEEIKSETACYILFKSFSGKKMK